MTTGFLAIGAVNSQNNLLFFAFGLAVAGLLVSGFISGSGLMGIRIERLAQETVEADEVTTMRYRVSNRNRFMPAFGLSIHERGDRRGGLESRGFGRAIAFVDRVRAGETVIAEARVRPASRGLAELDVMEVTSTFPFGIVRKTIRRSQPEQVLVLPARLRLGRSVVDRLFGRAEHDTAGSSRRGVSNELWGLREYVPGDAARSIAWRPSARLDQVVVRQTAEPNAARVRIVLDVRPQPGVGEQARERAIALAAAIGRRLAARGLPTRLEILGDGGVPGGWVTGTFARELERLALLDLAALGSGGGEDGPAGRDALEVVVTSGSGAVGERAGRIVLPAEAIAHLLAAGETLPRSLGEEARA
ncbi:MAG: DUF58 domain-containing protein [Phycisphaerales bacterium JB037]